MSYRHSNSSQVSDDFHGLKDAISEADYSMDASDDRRDKKKETKKFLFKKDSKDKGYSTLSADNSQDSVFLVNTKSYKKPKTDNKKATLNVFKKSSKEDKHLKGIKESKDEKEMKRSKKVKEHGIEAGATGSASVSHYKHESMFGNSFENAVRYFASNDGVKVPLPIRICIDIIEQKGIDNESIYRHSTNKSLIESICESINCDKMETRLDELNADPNLACAIIKRFLKESKTPLVTDDVIALIEKFDPNLATDKAQKVEHLRRSISKLPPANFETFAYLVMHFHRVLAHNHSNKIEVSLFVQKFQPLFRIKERTFKFFIVNADLIFNDFRFKKCRIRINDESNSRLSQLPDSIEGLEQEIAKQEVHLAKLHSQIANEENSANKAEQERLCEELWTLQRYVTSLKRKVKKLKNERKMMELEQSKSTNEGILSKADENSTDVSNHTLTDLFSKEINIICENLVLIESVQNYLNQISKEKVMISELHQKLLNGYANGDSSIPSGVTNNGVGSSLLELKENEQLLINENKLLEERINLINRRIKNEKDKIFELKLNIKLKTIENVNPPKGAFEQIVGSMVSSTSNPKSLNQMSVATSQVVAEPKELIMTKL